MVNSKKALKRIALGLFSTANGSETVYGALGGSRTPDPQVRSLMLYPAELPAQNADNFRCKRTT